MLPRRRVITDSVSREDKAIGGVRLSVRLLQLCLLNQQLLNLSLWMCVGHGHLAWD